MIFRVEKNENYTVMSNYHLREKRMSLKAKGLLSWMLSNTDDWDYSITGIVSNCKENETSIKSALKELQQFGYLEIKKLLPESHINENGEKEIVRGRIEYEYIIHEQPMDIQGVEIQDIEIQCVENQRQINTKIRNTKEINNNKDFNANFGKKPLVKETLYTKCEKEIFKFSKDDTVKNTLMAYLDVWITLRDKHPSYEGWKRILNKLKTQFIEEDWIDIIKNSIKKRYATFCQPTTYESRPTKKFDEHINRDGRYDSVSHARTGGKVF